MRLSSTTFDLYKKRFLQGDNAILIGSFVRLVTSYLQLFTQI